MDTTTPTPDADGIGAPRAVELIDLTPTWTALLPVLLAVMQDGQPDGRRLARTELQRLCRMADELMPKLIGAVRAIDAALASDPRHQGGLPEAYGPAAAAIHEALELVKQFGQR